MTKQVRLLAAAVTVLALVVVLLIVLVVRQQQVGDGSTAANAPGSTSDSAPAASPTPGLTDGAPAGLERFYGQSLAWTSCGGDKQCATLTVPVDYDQPEGETIGLHLARVLAADPSQRVGSLLVNPGGPGEPGSDMVDDPSFYFGQPLLDHYDIVGFDPRGTGQSSPVTCLDDAQLDDYVAQDPDPDTTAEAQAYGRTQRAFFEGCAQKSPTMAGHVSTVEAARDLDVLRAALGEPTMDYLGFSYGTKLGATYASLFPDRVGRMVLDGAVDPELSTKQAALTQAGGFQTALDAYVQHCLAEPGGCFLGDSQSAALSRISGLLDSIEAAPLSTSSGRQLTGGNAFYGVAVTLYSRDYWTLLDSALQTALQGDGSVLLQLSDAYAARNQDGGYMNNSLQAFAAISCLDDPTAVNPTSVARSFSEFERVSPTFGRVFAYGLSGCYGDPERAVEPPPTIKADGAPPIVVIGTTRDPATPLAEAQALARELSSGVLITRDGDGHTGYNKGNACVDDAVESYLDDGTVPQDDLMC